MSDIKFIDNRVAVESALNESITAFLYEAGGELEAQTKRNTRVDTGQLKNAWTYKVNADKGECVIGNPLENAIWEEFGTGEYALKGNGRKRGWRYQDDKGNWHFTTGKKPNRALFNAFNSMKSALEKRMNSIIKARFK